MQTSELVENVTCFEFSRMSYMLGSLQIKMELKNGVRTVRTESMMHFSDCGNGEKIVSEEEWNAFFEKLFSEFGVMELKRMYKIDGIIMDGEYWSLSVKFANRRAKNSEGETVFPECWDELAEVIQRFAKIDT